MHKALLKARLRQCRRPRRQIKPVGEKPRGASEILGRSRKTPQALSLQNMRRSADLICFMVAAGVSAGKEKRRCSGPLQSLLDLLVFAADDGLERRNHVADHILGASCGWRLAAFACTIHHGNIDEQRVLGDGEGMVAGGLSVPASNTRQPVSDVANLDVERGNRSDRSSLRPESMRCHARADFALHGLASTRFRANLRDAGRK